MTFSSQALQPIYNLPIQYKQGGKITWASNTTLQIEACLIRGQFDNIDINVGDYFGDVTGSASATILNGAVNGLNGLDTGSLAASTVYYVYAVADQAGYNPSGFLLSTSTTPLLPSGNFPSGYNAYALIGYAVTDSSSHFLKLIAAGHGTLVDYYYDTPVQVLNAGTANTQTAISLATAVPAIDGMTVHLGTTFTANAAGDTAKLCFSGGTIANSHNLITGQRAGAITPTLDVPSVLVSGVPKIDYILSTASASLSVWVNGFTVRLL